MRLVTLNSVPLRANFSEVTITILHSEMVKYIQSGDFEAREIIMPRSVPRGYISY